MKLTKAEIEQIIDYEVVVDCYSEEEANMGWAIAKKKIFFMGKKAIDVINARPLKRKLVGFTLPLDSPLPEECNLVVKDNEITIKIL